MKKFIKHVLRILYLIKKTNFNGITVRESKNIVWLKVRSIKFFKDDFVNYLGTINSLSNNGVKFNISFTNKIGRFTDKNIFIRYSKGLDPFKFSNYTQTIYFYCKQWEEQRCSVYPGSNEILFWENKGYMTQQFIDLNISTPQTFLITKRDDFNSIKLSFPYLIKEEHSASSAGLHKINSEDDLNQFFNKNNYFSRNKFLLAQELLNMRRDLRVILVGDKIVHHYWRINKSNEWKPTSTSFGSGVDFGSFPEQWREFIINEFKKLNINTGAFDIAWRNDDLSTTPLILEVSPNYQPNPAVDLSKMKFSYGEYKDKLLFKDSYDFKFVDIVFEIIEKQIQYILDSNTKKPSM